MSKLNFTFSVPSKTILLIVWLFLLSDLHAQQQLEVTVQGGHTSYIRKMCFSSDGSLLASADESGKLTVWNVSTGSQLSNSTTGLRILSMLFVNDTTIAYAGKDLIQEIIPQKEVVKKGLFNRTKEATLETPTDFILYNISTGARRETASIADLMPQSTTYSQDFNLIYKGQIVYTHRYHDEAFTDFFVDAANNRIYTSCSDGRYYVISTTGKRIKKSGRYHAGQMTSIAVSANTKYIASAGQDKKIVVWDGNRHEPLKELLPRVNAITALTIVPGKNEVMYADINGRLKLLNLADYKLPVSLISSNKVFIDKLAASGKWGIAASDISNKISFYKNSQIVSTVTQFPGISRRIIKNSNTFKVSSNRHLSFSPDSLALLASGGFYKNRLTVFNLQKKYRYSPITGPYRYNIERQERSAFLTDNTFLSSDGKQFLNWESSRTGTFFNASEPKIPTCHNLMYYRPDTCIAVCKNAIYSISKNQLLQYHLLTDKVTASAYSLLQHYKYNQIVVSNAGTLQFGNRTSGVFVSSGNSHSGDITGISYIDNGSKVISGSVDGTLKIWNSITGELILTVLPIDESERMLITPDNYYMAPRGLTNEVGFKLGMNYYPAEQFDLKYNRPDIVLSRLKGADNHLISLLHNAYKKRLQRLGLTEEELSNDADVPQIEISNKKSVPLSTKESVLNLDVRASDALHPLKKINVWVNNVPIFGKSGLPATGKSWEKSGVAIPLTPGNNLIQVSCVNNAGAESLRDALSVTYNAPKQTLPDLFIVSISVSDYEDKRWSLKYPVKDGRDVVATFTENKKLFGQVHIDTLFNASAITKNIETLRQKLLQSKTNDYIIVFLSGHGLLSSNGDFYFATWDCNFNQPEKNGLPFLSVENLLDSIPARNKLLLMDACHSGELDKTDWQNPSATKQPDDKNIQGLLLSSGKKGAIVDNEEKPASLHGLNNSFELMKDLFTDVNKGSGTIVISAAAGNSFALEGDKWKNGVFTYSLLEGIKTRKADLNGDKRVNVGELKEYVSNRVYQITDGKQKPTSRQENLYNNFVIWK